MANFCGKVPTRPIRHDGLDKVTGRARYGADIDLPGLLHGKILRSPYAHAIIKKIDVSKARALPGVRAVVTGGDFPTPSARTDVVAEGGFQNLGFMSQNCMAKDKALYVGHAVAAVAATQATAVALERAGRVFGRAAKGNSLFRNK